MTTPLLRLMDNFFGTLDHMIFLLYRQTWNPYLNLWSILWTPVAALTVNKDPISEENKKVPIETHSFGVSAIGSPSNFLQLYFLQSSQIRLVHGDWWHKYRNGY